MTQSGRSGTRPSHTRVFLCHDLLPQMSSGDATTQDAAAGSSKHAFSLENILGADHESVEHPTATKEALTGANGWDEETGQQHVAQGFCVECEGT